MINPSDTISREEVTSVYELPEVKLKFNLVAETAEQAPSLNETR